VWNLLLNHHGRWKLAKALREKGFYVRMHAYEYLVGDGRKLLAIVLLEPRLNKAYLYALDENIERIADTIKSIEPSVKIMIRRVCIEP